MAKNGYLEKQAAMRKGFFLAGPPLAVGKEDNEKIEKTHHHRPEIRTSR